jgi:hypothetical protein
VALAARLLYVSLVPPRILPDSHEYQTLADNVRQHGVFSLKTAPPYLPSTRRGPAYPMFLAVFGDASRGVQCILDALVAVMICALAARWVRLRWAVAAGFLYALHPGALVYANSILVESLLTFLLASTVALLSWRPGLVAASLAGVTLALAAQCRAIVVPFVIVVAAILLWRRLGVAAAALCAAFVLALAPWIIRSSVLAGRFVLIQAGSPVNLALATANVPWNLNDQASIYEGGYYVNLDPCGRAMRDPSRSPRELAKSDDICLAEALDNLKKDPGRYARSRVSQLIHFPLSSFDFATGNRLALGDALRQGQYGVLTTKGALYAVFSLVPLLLGIAGALFGAPAIENRLSSALWIFTLVIYAPGFVEYRYFMSAVPMLLVCAAFGIDRITSRT